MKEQSNKHITLSKKFWFAETNKEISPQLVYPSIKQLFDRLNNYLFVYLANNFVVVVCSVV